MSGRRAVDVVVAVNHQVRYQPERSVWDDAMVHALVEETRLLLDALEEAQSPGCRVVRIGGPGSDALKKTVETVSEFAALYSTAAPGLRLHD